MRYKKTGVCICISPKQRKALLKNLAILEGYQLLHDDEPQAPYYRIQPLDDFGHVLHDKKTEFAYKIQMLGLILYCQSWRHKGTGDIRLVDPYAYYQTISNIVAQWRLKTIPKKEYVYVSIWADVLYVTENPITLPHLKHISLE